ncbi:tryptophan synthase subunit alpha [Cognatiluteimonas lumbrici]|uniref:tryptophan synthase subunit alpha n=1 Tax=Cognatiluteimonas lumbrici TaxID=2559601 RepID=UPI001127E9E4|nr:tryptophan synthase subunit alpha [Luteimonas lumbrici]
MTRLQARFDALAAAGRKALVPFVTAGDPSLQATVPVLHALVAAGADALEIGVPFSDPMADGPVIQRSSERALARGAGLDWVLEQVRAFRAADDATPVVLMGYLNPVEVRGIDAYARQVAGAGVDGVLLVDLPPEEAGPTRACFDALGLALVPLVAPTTSAERLPAICAGARGYVYYVSVAGVTGTRAADAAATAAHLAAVRAACPLPVLAGFGIRDAATAAGMAAQADGVVVGSALVQAMAGAADPADAAARAGAFLAPLRAALDGPKPPLG